MMLCVFGIVLLGSSTAYAIPPTVTYLRGYRANFHAPARLATDAGGNIYIADPEKGEVALRAASGRIIARPNGLGRPVGIAIAPDGTIYVGDAASGSVTAFDTSWRKLRVLGQGNGEFLLPNDMAIDTATGNVYVVDSKADLIKVYDQTGQLASTFGGSGNAPGQFSFPVSIAIAGTEVFVVDEFNYRVQVLSLNGVPLRSFGSSGGSFSTSLRCNQFGAPQGIVVDGSGRVYVADILVGRIAVFDGSGGCLATIGDFGEGPGLFRSPADVAIDPSNRLLVASANNARVEMFGLDTFSDPETDAPATLTVEPNPLVRSAPQAAVVGHIAIEGYPLDQVIANTVAANGVPANVSTLAVGDNNGLPELRAEFDWTALLATLPQGGQATVTVTGMVGTMHFEASQVVAVQACGPTTVCSLGGADPGCNEAVCVEPLGCVVQAKPDTTPCAPGNACILDTQCVAGVCAGGTALNCDDGNVCTDDTCDPTSGCAYTNNTAPCSTGNACTANDACRDGVCAAGPPLNCDDGNICTDDVCDPASGCVYTNNSLTCTDGNACTTNDMCQAGVCTAGAPLDCDDGNICTTDTCDAASGCVHTNNTVACNDGDPGTVGDACNGAGTCTGHVVTGNYAIVGWVPTAGVNVSAVLGTSNIVGGNICADTVDVGSQSRVSGDIAAAEPVNVAVALRRQSQVRGDVVTGGGSISIAWGSSIAGSRDTSGASLQLSECVAARYHANSRKVDFDALPASSDLALGAIQLASATSQRIPATGTLGAGQIVIDLAALQLSRSAILTLAGGPATQQVLVRVHGFLAVGSAATIALDGLAPEQVIFVIDGTAVLGSRSRLSGTAFTAGNISAGDSATISGALVSGGNIKLGQSVTLDAHPFAWW